MATSFPGKYHIYGCPDAKNRTVMDPDIERIAFILIIHSRCVELPTKTAALGILVEPMGLCNYVPRSLD